MEPVEDQVINQRDLELKAAFDVKLQNQDTSASVLSEQAEGHSPPSDSS